MEPSITDWISAIATLAVAITAIVGVLWGYHQIKQIRQSNSNYLIIEKTRIVFEIDKRYESDSIEKSRKKFQLLINEAREIVDKNSPGLHGDEKIKRINEHVSNKLHELRHKDINGYLETMEIIGLWETVGILYRKDGLDKDFLMELFDSAIIKTVGAAYNHIKSRQDDPTDRNKAYMENALSLLDHARGHMSAKATAPPNGS